MYVDDPDTYIACAAKIILTKAKAEPVFYLSGLASLLKSYTGAYASLEVLSAERIVRVRIDTGSQPSNSAATGTSPTVADEVTASAQGGAHANAALSPQLTVKAPHRHDQGVQPCIADADCVPVRRVPWGIPAGVQQAERRTVFAAGDMCGESDGDMADVHNGRYGFARNSHGRSLHPGQVGVETADPYQDQNDQDQDLPTQSDDADMAGMDLYQGPRCSSNGNHVVRSPGDADSAGKHQQQQSNNCYQQDQQEDPSPSSSDGNIGLHLLADHAAMEGAIASEGSGQASEHDQASEGDSPASRPDNQKRRRLLPSQLHDRHANHYTPTTMHPSCRVEGTHACAADTPGFQGAGQNQLDSRSPVTCHVPPFTPNGSAAQAVDGPQRSAATSHVETPSLGLPLEQLSNLSHIPGLHPSSTPMEIFMRMADHADTNAVAVVQRVNSRHTGSSIKSEREGSMPVAASPAATAACQQQHEASTGTPSLQQMLNLGIYPSFLSMGLPHMPPGHAFAGVAAAASHGAGNPMEHSSLSRGSNGQLQHVGLVKAEDYTAHAYATKPPHLQLPRQHDMSAVVEAALSAATSAGLGAVSPMLSTAAFQPKHVKDGALPVLAGRPTSAAGLMPYPRAHLGKVLSSYLHNSSALGAPSSACAGPLDMPAGQGSSLQGQTPPPQQQQQQQPPTHASQAELPNLPHGSELPADSSAAPLGNHPRQQTHGGISYQPATAAGAFSAATPALPVCDSGGWPLLNDADSLLEVGKALVQVMNFLGAAGDARLALTRTIRAMSPEDREWLVSITYPHIQDICRRRSIPELRMIMNEIAGATCFPA